MQRFPGQIVRTIDDPNHGTDPGEEFKSKSGAVKMRIKLCAPLLIALSAGSFFLGCRVSHDPKIIPVVADSSPIAGVDVIAPGDPRFDQEARQLVGAKLELVKTLSPLLLLIKNNSQHTIVAYSPAWELKRGSEEIPFVSVRMFPMAISGQDCDAPHDRPLHPGEARLEGMNSEVSIHPDDASTDAGYQAEDLAGVTAVKASLDAVIFDDGILLGPDRHNLAGRFVRSVEDRQSLYRTIAAKLQTGEPAENVYDNLEQGRRQEFDASTHANPPWNSMMMEKLIAEQDVLGAWRNHRNDDSLAHFSGCIRTPPFAITRKN